MPGSELADPGDSLPTPRRRGRRSLRLAGSAVLLLLFVFSFCHDGYVTLTTGEFRAVERAGLWYAFDNGERPDIDGLRFVGEPVELPARTNLAQRLARPVVRDPATERFLVVIGTLRVDHSPLKLARHWGVPYIVRREPWYHLQAVEVSPPDQGQVLHISECDLEPALPVIADYLDRHYPGTGLGEQLRRGPGVQHTLDPRQLPILALQVLLLVASLALAAPWRWRRCVRCASGSQPDRAERRARL